MMGINKHSHSSSDVHSQQVDETGDSV